MLLTGRCRGGAIGTRCSGLGSSPGRRSACCGWGGTGTGTAQGGIGRLRALSGGSFLRKLKIILK